MRVVDFFFYNPISGYGSNIRSMERRRHLFQRRTTTVCGAPHRRPSWRPPHASQKLEISILPAQIPADAWPRTSPRPCLLRHRSLHQLDRSPSHHRWIGVGSRCPPLLRDRTTFVKVSQLLQEIWGRQVRVVAFPLVLVWSLRDWLLLFEQMQPYNEYLLCSLKEREKERGIWFNS
jgi:hypothetical protein